MNPDIKKFGFPASLAMSSAAVSYPAEINNADLNSSMGAVFGALFAVWGVKKMLDIMIRPSKLELFMYSYTIKSKRKYKKVKFRKLFNKKYILSDSRLKEISKYNLEQKEKKIIKDDEIEKN